MNVVSILIFIKIQIEIAICSRDHASINIINSNDLSILYLLCFLETSCRCLGLPEVIIKLVLVVEIALDGVEIYQNILKLFEEEEATCHALSAGNCVTLTSTASNQLSKCGVSSENSAMGVEYWAVRSEYLNSE